MTAPSKPPTPKTSLLSTVYLDQRRIGLMGDPKPMVAKIVTVGGRLPAEVRVVRSRTPDDAGTPVHLEDIIDRTADPTKAIYLTCVPREPRDARAAPGHYIAWPMPAEPPTARGPLPQQPDPVAPRPQPAPGGPGLAEPEWGTKTG